MHDLIKEFNAIERVRQGLWVDCIDVQAKLCRMHYKYCYNTCRCLRLLAWRRMEYTECGIYNIFERIHIGMCVLHINR